MIAHHAAIARTMAEQLSLPDEVVEALGAAYERWDGRGWPGELEGAGVPLASRLALREDRRIQPRCRRPVRDAARLLPEEEFPVGVPA
jgi:hypothetical protein